MRSLSLSCKSPLRHCRDPHCILEGCKRPCRLHWIAHDLVLEYREVQSKAETDRMCDGLVFLCHLLGLVVSQTCALRCTCLLVAIRELGNIAVVVSLHDEIVVPES